MDLSHKVSILNRRLEDVHIAKREFLFAKYRDERIRYLTVIFAKEYGLIPENYTDPEFERAIKIIHSLPKPKAQTKSFMSEEDRKKRIKRLIEWYLSKDALRKYIPKFDNIKLKSPEEVLTE